MTAPAPVANPFNRPAPPPADAKRVLVIKLGAMGDFIQALAAARLIRQYHVGARITLLTTEPFEKFAEACPYFDVVEADGRPREPQALTKLIARIRAAKYEMIYDLQTSDRSSNYFHGLKPWPPKWSGIAPGCAYPHANPARETMHSLDRLADQLWFTGLGPQNGFPIGQAPLPDLSWVRVAMKDAPRLQPEYFGFKRPYVLMIPGASPHRPEKRWLATKYGELAKKIADAGVTPVVLGHTDEREAAATIVKAEPRTKNLVSRTDLFQIAALAETAAGAVGNDTGPMHIAAAAGAACVVLFSTKASDPEKVAPRSVGGVLTLHGPDLALLAVDDVFRALKNVGAIA
jgi:ADP-heptose:LPS heptosyltransferase